MISFNYLCSDGLDQFNASVILKAVAILDQIPEAKKVMDAKGGGDADHSLKGPYVPLYIRKEYTFHAQYRV